MNTNQTAQTQSTAINPEANSQPYIPTKEDLNFAPVLTMEQVQEHESNNDINIRRRILSVALTKSGQELYEAFSKDDEILADMMEYASEHIKYLEASLELAKSIEARLYVVASVVLQDIEEQQKQQVH